MEDIEAAYDFDLFFYYGENDLLTEVLTDVQMGILQPKRSLFYNRQEGAGIQENVPNGIFQAVMLKFDIVNYIAFRNGRVADGTNGTKERRAVSSQNYISVTKDNKGNMDADVLIMPFFDFRKTKNLNIPITGAA